MRAEKDDATFRGSTLLEEKVDSILASPAFLRAPILSRLLRYLLDQTLAGEADSLKAYTVAVEGLDRPVDFDAQFDSYPRVQMVRLRKALETYYADDPSQPDPCVYLCVRSYRLQLVARETVYSNTPRISRVDFPAIQSLVTPPGAVGGRLKRRRTLMVLGIMLAGLFSFIVFQVYNGKATTRNTVGMPVVEIGFRNAASAQHGDEVTEILSGALTRSWVAQVRDRSIGTSAMAQLPTYRIMLNESDRGVDAQLVDARSDMIIWTDSVAIDPNGALREELAPMIAELVGPYGVIARTEANQLKPQSTGSFACILRYFAFVKSRDAAERARVAACLEQPVDEPRLTATVDAVRSFFALEATALPDRERQMAVAEQFARLATVADAKDPYTYYANARLAYLRSNCAAGLFNADRAVAANPYDAMIVTVLSGLTTPCSRPKAAAMLDQAYRIRNDNDVAMRSSLIFATIAQGQEKRLAELGFLLRPPPGPLLPGYLLAESLTAASQGRSVEAAALWRELRSLRSSPGASDDDMLKRIILSDALRQQVLDLLRTRGAITS
ncbi:MAG: hypothetical protein ABI898_00215 [Sphingomonadales bacterium]